MTARKEFLEYQPPGGKRPGSPRGCLPLPLFALSLVGSLVVMGWRMQPGHDFPGLLVVAAAVASIVFAVGGSAALVLGAFRPKTADDLWGVALIAALVCWTPILVGLLMFLIVLIG